MLLIGQVGQFVQKGQVLLIDHEVQMMHEFQRVHVLVMVQKAQMVHEFGVLECEEVKSLESQELEVVEM